MTAPLGGLRLSIPVIVAPMAGGPSTPALVIAAAQAGGLGFLAAGYKTPQALAAQVAEVRSATEMFGVNVFAPNPVPASPVAFREYAQAIEREAQRYGLSLADSEPVEDDDFWQEKVDILLADPVPVVSFTFGIPARGVIAAFRSAGTLVVQTVTSAAEALLAADAGADVLAVQASAAGGHSGTLTPARIPPPTPLTRLIAEVQVVTALPLLAAGGLAVPADVAEVIRAGAAAAVVGTMLLRADESGASPVHKAALAAGSRDTVITRAFTGRPARGLRNDFIDSYSAVAPDGYPALHHLTSPLRKAAVAAGDPEVVNMWAGTGYRHATAGPAAAMLARLTEQL